VGNKTEKRKMGKSRRKGGVGGEGGREGGREERQ